MDAIRCADFLAKTAHEITEELIVYTIPPLGCTQLMREDFAKSQNMAESHTSNDLILCKQQRIRLLLRSV